MSTLDLGDLRISYHLDKDGLKSGLRESEQEVKASGDRQGRSVLETALQWAREVVRGWGRAGHQASSQFWQDAGGRWHDAAGRFVSAATATGQAAGQGAAGGLGLFSSALRMLGNGINSINFDMGSLIKWTLILGAVIASIAPATQLLGGLLGALPALATGGIAAIATLGLGFLGLTDAFKKTSSSGGSTVDRLHQVAMAERRVADANREVTASQEALNRARKTAAERLQDLNRNLNGARIDQADALDAVAKAKHDLERATEGDNPDQIRAAERALERANQRLDDAKDRYEDLSEEQAEASKAGVEGSDEVTAALDRQRRATEGVEDATYDLKRAQQPTGGGAANEAMKIAASALAAVNAIKSLAGEANSLRLDVQERIFAGTDVEIKSLWASWLPVLRTRLGSMGDMFNGQFKAWAATSRKPEFISNIAAGWESVERLIDRVGKAVAGPGLEAFGKLSRAAGPMVDAIGDSFGGMIDKFGEWIDKAERSGALDKFFVDAGQFFRDVMSIGGSTVRIIGSVIGILMGGSERTREGATKGFVVKMKELADWFADPANSSKIEGWIKKIEDFILWIINVAVPTVASWIDKVTEWGSRVRGWVDKAIAFKDGVVGAIDSVTAAVTGMPGRIAAAATGMWDGLKNSFKSAMNWIIGKWNNLSLTVSGGTFLGQKIDAFTFTTPDIPMLAGGGLVRATPGGRMVGVAEAGQDEIVSPVDQMRQIVAEELARVQNERGPKYADIHVHVGDEVTRVIRVELKEHDRQNKRSATAGAGTR